MAKFTIQKVSQLIAYHENAAATLRAAVALVSGSTGMPKTLRAAVELDDARRMWSANGSGAETAHHKSKATAKRYTAKSTRPGPKPGAHTSAMLKRRAATASALAKFDATKPRTPAEVGIASVNMLGPVVRRGYLKPVGEGYVRTSKPFLVDPRPGKS